MTAFPLSILETMYSGDLFAIPVPLSLAESSMVLQMASAYLLCELFVVTILNVPVLS
jgi:hypothetical protein